MDRVPTCKILGALLAKARDREFTEWVNQRQLMLIRAARGICFDKQLADDVLQEALADVFKRWEKIKDHENLEAYAIRVMISRHADMRRKIRRTHDDRDFGLDQVAEIAAHADESEDLAQRLMVQSAMKSLSPAQRAVMMLHYEYGFALREVAKVLDIPAGTVASHLARGKAAVATYVNFLPEIMDADKKKITANQMTEIENWTVKELNE